MTEKMLKLMGHSVIVASNGQEAVNITLEQKFDLILMDMQMPILDGIAASIQIRQNFTNPNRDTNIYALTANAFDEDRELCLSSGMDGFITKPVTRALLSNIIESVHSGDSNTHKTDNQQTLSLINYDMLNDVSEEDRAVIIEEVLNDVPDRLNLLKKYIDNLEFDKISEYCHKLRGVFLMFEAKEIILYFDRMRLLYKDKIKEGYHPLFEQLSAKTDIFLNELKDYLYKLKILK